MNTEVNTLAIWRDLSASLRDLSASLRDLSAIWRDLSDDELNEGCVDSMVSNG